MLTFEAGARVRQRKVTNGPFRGELGDALEGSIRTIGMIKWPGKITPRVSNEMVSVHDWFPTLAGIIGAKVPMKSGGATPAMVYDWDSDSIRWPTTSGLRLNRRCQSA